MTYIDGGKKQISIKLGAIATNGNQIRVQH